MCKVVKVSFGCFFLPYISLTGLGVVYDRDHVDRLYYLLTVLPFIFTLIVAYCGHNIFSYPIDFGLGHMILTNGI